MRTAFQRSIKEDDFTTPMMLFKDAPKRDELESAIEFALASNWVNPNFLLRVEQLPEDLAGESSYPIGGFQLATRHSFFI